MTGRRFEPFILYQHSLRPSRIHSLWGEFKPLSATYPPDPQLAALAKTLEGLRREFASSILLLNTYLQDSVPGLLAGAAQVRFRSRYGLQEHNGGMWEYASTPVWLIDVTELESVDFPALVSVESSAAVLFLSKPTSLAYLERLFDGAPDLDSLRSELLLNAAMYIGFDHDAFFTLETRDDQLFAEVVQSAHAPTRRINSGPKGHRRWFRLGRSP